MLAFGADLLIRGAIEMTERLAVGQALVGLTVVAVGTSLPELATSVIAAWKGQSDISVGNFVGFCHEALGGRGADYYLCGLYCYANAMI